MSVGRAAVAAGAHGHRAMHLSSCSTRDMLVGVLGTAVRVGRDARPSREGGDSAG
jgi:hypothetical protein